jgi:hypothetical protein
VSVEAQPIVFADTTHDVAVAAKWRQIGS